MKELLARLTLRLRSLDAVNNTIGQASSNGANAIPALSGALTSLGVLNSLLLWDIINPALQSLTALKLGEGPVAVQYRQQRRIFWRSLGPVDRSNSPKSSFDAATDRFVARHRVPIYKDAVRLNSLMDDLVPNGARVMQDDRPSLNFFPNDPKLISLMDDWDKWVSSKEHWFEGDNFLEDHGGRLTAELSTLPKEGGLCKMLLKMRYSNGSKVEVQIPSWGYRSQFERIVQWVSSLSPTWTDFGVAVRKTLNLYSVNDEFSKLHPELGNILDFNLDVYSSLEDATWPGGLNYVPHELMREMVIRLFKANGYDFKVENNIPVPDGLDLYVQWAAVEEEQGPISVDGSKRTSQQVHQLAEVSAGRGWREPDLVEFVMVQKDEETGGDELIGSAIIHAFSFNQERYNALLMVSDLSESACLKVCSTKDGVWLGMTPKTHHYLMSEIIKLRAQAAKQYKDAEGA